MKSKIMLVLAVGLFSMSAFAQREVGNGGDGVVTSTGAIRLRDLVDPGNCTWRSGKSVYGQQPAVADVLEKIKKVNPYLAHGLSEQLLKIKWCFTTTLKKVDTNDDAESLTYYVDPYAQNKIQAGIRAVNNVYIDSALLSADLNGGSMSVNDRPYFYIHEAMHAFLPMKTPMRNKRVRDAVHAIKDFNDGVTNSDDLDAMIAGSELLVPESKSVVQNLVRVLNDLSISIQERIKIAEPIMSPNNQAESIKQFFELNKFFTLAEFAKLTELTGLARFEFLSRGHDYLRFENNMITSWNINVLYSNKANVLGRCSFSSALFDKIGLLNKDFRFTVRDIFSDEVIYSNRYSRYDSNFVGAQILKAAFFQSLCDFTPAQ
jgi:hypothetical protein